MTTLGLDEHICFALYSASRSITARYRELLAPLGVTYPQYLVLLILWGEPQPVTVSALGERLQLDSGTLSPLLRRLADGGLVERTRSSTDERSVLISLTDAGLGLEKSATGIPARICEATGLSPADLGALRQQISELASHVRSANDGAQPAGAAEPATASVT